MAKPGRKAAKAAQAAKTTKPRRSNAGDSPAARADKPGGRHSTTRSAAPLSDSGLARAAARQWADNARSGSARTAALNGQKLAAAVAGGDRRLAEYCMELLAELPAPILFSIGVEHLGHGTQEHRWALAQTLAQAFQRKPLIETGELAERCLQQALSLIGSAQAARPAAAPKKDAAGEPGADNVFLSQAILWLEAMNGSNIWLQPTERMKLLAQKISTAAQRLAPDDQDNLRTVLLRLVAALPELWAEELMIDALSRSPWAAFAGIEALRGHPGARIDAALWSTLARQPADASPLVIKALYGALTERQPVELLVDLWTRLGDCPPAWLALHVRLVAACAQKQPALAAQVARDAASDRALTRLFAIPVADGAYSAFHACEILARVGRAEHAEAMAALANRFVGEAGFEMVAFACSRTLRQWVGAEQARKLLKERVGS